MFLDLTPEQHALRSELRAYFAALMTPEVREKLGHGVERQGGEAYRSVVRRMGADGWLGVGWPREYGGRGFGPMEQYLFYEEAERAGAPVPLVTLNTVGPTLIRYGTPEQKDRYLPGILRGETYFAVGYTEPQAGTDLASLTTRAERDGDGWVINGQKVFTTGAHFADHIWLAARTDPDRPKHRGLTVFIVDTDAPGFSLTPTETLGGHRTNTTYYEHVRVPASAVVGAVNEGWTLMTTQLNHERIALASAGRVERVLDEVRCWAATTAGPGGRAVIDAPWVRLALARIRAKVDALRLLNLRLAWELASDRLNPADASAVKVFGTELYLEAYRLLLEIVGPAGCLEEGAAGAVLDGVVQLAYRYALVLTFGGGVNEVQRQIIATAGLGMPRGGTA